MVVATEEDQEFQDPYQVIIDPTIIPHQYDLQGIDQAQWIYAPDRNMTRAEVVKTVAKIVGSYFDDFTIQSEDQAYPTPTQFADVAQDYWFAWYADYAAKK